MTRIVLIAIFAYFVASASCQGHQEFLRSESLKGGGERPSMLGSTTDKLLSARMWLNATERPLGICEREEDVTEEVVVTNRVPYQVEVDVWCWPDIRCTEWETHYREEKETKNVTQTRKIRECCENYEIDEETGDCRPICVRGCENAGVCVEPNVCQCQFGYEGPHCEHDALPENVLAGPNVCERVEMHEVMERVEEQELVETTYKEWCWPKIRCSHTKQEFVPVAKHKSVVKPHPVKYCCNGYAKNYRGNRCLPIDGAEEFQQQVVQ